MIIRSQTDFVLGGLPLPGSIVVFLSFSCFQSGAYQFPNPPEKQDVMKFPLLRISHLFSLTAVSKHVPRSR